MLFTPLHREHCSFFYFLSVISFALFVVTMAIGLFSQNKKWKMLLLASVTPFLGYYVYRLLFSMCNASLPV
jgi:hypothetical protein